MYEYAKRSLGVTREVSGLGYSDYSRWGNIDWCSEAPDRQDSRMLCFVDNDILDQTTAERAGCVRAHRHTWLSFGAPREITCETESGNAGHVWCCPRGAVRDMPMTQAERERATELLLAEQRAREEGRLPEATTADVAKEPTIERGRTEEISPQETIASTFSKVIANPAWIAAALAIGGAAYIGYRYYFIKQRPRRRSVALAGVR